MEKLKNIRFNLRFFNGSDSFESIHSVEELEDKLRTNQIAFDDLMAYFFSGQLQRWLECHGDKDAVLLEKLRDIDTKAPNKQIVKALFAALDFCFDEQEIDRMIVSYDFPTRLQKATQECSKTAEVQLNSIQNEVDAYEAVCRQILEGRQDILITRKLVGKIIDKYLPLLGLDVARFFYRMKNPKTGCPAAILEMLAHNRTRELFITRFESATQSGETAVQYARMRVALLRRNPYDERMTGAPWLDFERNQSATKFYIKIDGEYVEHPEPINYVEDYSDAANSWKVLLPKGRRVMILCNSGVVVRDGAGKRWEESALNHHFAILDGCNYMMLFKTKAFLAYMEL